MIKSRNEIGFNSKLYKTKENMAKKKVEPIVEVKRTFWQELKYRWNSESPLFWQKAQKISVFLGSSAASLIAANTTFGLIALGVPAVLFTVCGYMIAFCVAVGLSAKLTVI